MLWTIGHHMAYLYQRRCNMSWNLSKCTTWKCKTSPNLMEKNHKVQSKQRLALFMTRKAACGRLILEIKLDALKFGSCNLFIVQYQVLWICFFSLKIWVGNAFYTGTLLPSTLWKAILQKAQWLRWTSTMKKFFFLPWILTINKHSKANSKMCWK